MAKPSNGLESIIFDWPGSMIAILESTINFSCRLIGAVQELRLGIVHN